MQTSKVFVRDCVD